MNKRLMIVTIVVLTMLVIATPALAASPGKQIPTLYGTITTIGENSFGVYVVDANRFAEAYIGQEITVLVTDTTVFYDADYNPKVEIEFGDIGSGDPVNIKGVFLGNAFYALQVTINVVCPQNP